MAKGIAKPRPKGQKSIASFFGGTNGKTKADEASAASSDVDMDEPEATTRTAKKTAKASKKANPKADEASAASSDADMDESEVATARTTKKPVKAAKKAKPKVDREYSDDEADEADEITTGAAKKGGKSDVLTGELPPIHEIPKIFADLVSHIPKIKDVVEHVNGRKLRVATMCSGTESPLLALELIQESIHEEHGLKLEIEHVFSCEIEPFKQAYIERNFHPPLLFRDVCELGQAEAHTAYGALAPVPGDVDLLVAGTSCVDYSNLNNEKQDIDANGESGRTFRGMMSWVTNHRPPIVILENVCSAPWERVKEKFEHHGYKAAWSRVDTKQYYIPHTRTRVYLVAIDTKDKKLPEAWKECLLQKLKRPASSTLDKFLLPTDDPRIHQARQKLVQESYNAADRRTGRTDWGRCESRHQRARLEEELGAKRPLTSWDEGGYSKLLDFAWGDWGVGQVERVWDLMDISLLRSAKNGVDPSYKTQVWNLSQNVDRSYGAKLGICPCLTPSMIPYITNRGGPMVGLEALSMQGLPVDKLLLTRETEDQLADLAGNAMSTTVVGACILAALATAGSLLKAGDDKETYEVKADTIAKVNPADDSVMVVDEPADESTPIADHIIGEDQLELKPLDLSATGFFSLEDLLADAERSARLCSCEGRVDMTSRELFRCIDCANSSCKKCGGRPEHNVELIDVIANPRLPPPDFAKKLKSTLPMRISLSNVTQESLDNLKSSEKLSIPDKLWASWSAAVLRASQSELRFVELKRQEIWSAIFRSTDAVAELLLHPQQPEWRLYAMAEEHEPAVAEIRQVLETPVGRLTCKGELLAGRWEFALPYASSISVTIRGAGELVPSWQARLGLTGDEHKDSEVHSQVQISVREEDLKKLDRDISGTYTLLDRCGTANSALHKREAKDESLPSLFLFLDPLRTSDTEDPFVFSISKRRYEYGETRPVIAKLAPSWRQSAVEEEEQIDCRIPSHWIAADDIKLHPSDDQDARFGIPGQKLSISASNDACRSAIALLVCTIPIRGQAGREWPRGNWGEVDKVHERGTFQSLAWLLERIRHVDDHFSSWQDVDLPPDLSNCERCAPTPPAVEWTKGSKNKMVPIEDPVQAGKYERSLKKRPTAFITQLRLDENNNGTVRVGINVTSLLHRALSRLPSKNGTEKPSLTWRLNTNFVPIAASILPKFVLMSNKNDKEHAQPPHFKIPLRKEQLRSLEWMLAQESSRAEPFVEEEISEAILSPLGWRAEGRARRAIHVRGGVLADQVGYGKTAITLGLIDCTSKEVDKEFEKTKRIPGKIALKATLIIVPPHLTRQWKSEVGKFMKIKPDILLLSTVSDLNKATIEDFQNADIIVVASNIFKSNVYLENLQLLAGGRELPSQDGRHFNALLQASLETLKEQTDRLQDEGSSAVMKAIHEARAKAEAAAEAARVQTKRLKGRSYREAAQAEEAKKKSAEKPALAKLTPSGRIMEVVIPVRKSSDSSKPESSAADQSGHDSEDRPIRKRRASAKKVTIIESDDESSAESEPEVRKKAVKAKPSKVPAKKSLKSKRKATSDDEDFIVVGSDDEDEAGDVSGSDSYHSSASEDEDARPSKSKGKPKPKPKIVPERASSPPSSTTGTEDDSMAVDEPAVKAAKKGVKRKSANGDEPPAKKQKRVDTDPWKLESKPVKKDWTQMKAPPLEMFHFARKVVDEYTYLDGKVLSLVTKLAAGRQWVLSGTPPTHDFGALKTISAFLDIHLGIDDDGEGQSAEIKKRKRDQTAVEKFHSFREVHTLEWHAHRHQQGQIFLDRFVRQNIAEIDEIPWTEKIEDITLPAAERAIYLELEHHLRALDMTIKRGKKTESDREKRLAKSLGDSKSAEEALLKRCSHFELETNNENAMKACDVIVKEREKQLTECKAELLRDIKAGAKTEKDLGDLGTESLFHEWIRNCRAGEIDDKDASDIVVDLIQEAGVGVVKARAKREEKSLTEAKKAAAWAHREKTHEIRRLTKELVARVRSLRYFTVVRNLQKQREEPPHISCPACGRKEIPIEEAAVLSSCGHMGCEACVRACADKEECVFAASGACRSAARHLNVVKADTLGVDDAERDGLGKHFGAKLEGVVKLIKERIPKDERVLLFVQFPDLMKKVTETLDYNDIPYLEIRGSATMKSKNLEAFQNKSKEQVLLLNVMDESASGANLTSANHAIFLSPLLAASKEIYDACETQAVGRLVRFGQDKHVSVWRFITKNTIDEQIFEDRKKAAQDA